MRRYFVHLFILALVLGTACQPVVDVEKEKEAIMALIHEEADAIIAGDQDRLFATHMQDDMETRMELGVYGHRIFSGWEEIHSLFEGIVGDGGLEGYTYSKENVSMKVTGNCAWLTCDNIWSWTIDGEEDSFANIQITFLEKVKGEWKISFAAYYNKPLPVPGVEEHFIK